MARLFPGVLKSGSFATGAMSPLATAAPLGAPAPGGDRRALRLGASRPNIAARIRLLALVQSASVGRVGRLFWQAPTVIFADGLQCATPMVNCSRVCLYVRSVLSTAKFRYFGASARTLYDVSSVSKVDATPHSTLPDAPLVHQLLHHVMIVKNIPPRQKDRISARRRRPRQSPRCPPSPP